MSIMSDLVFRPVQLKDLDQIFYLSTLTQIGLTSLPNDKALLKKKIQFSVDCFQANVNVVHNEYYLFVLEDIMHQKIVGVSALLASVGCDVPFISFVKRHHLSKSNSFNLSSSYTTLELDYNSEGPSELLSLFLHPDYRHQSVGRFLSLARLLFVKRHPWRFKKNVISEIRGAINHHGQSDFYDYVIRPFLRMSFERADYLSQVDKQFLFDLLPKTAIICDHFPEHISANLGQTHRLSQSAMTILCSEGFSQTGAIDVLDAGPKIMADFKQLRVYSQSKRYPFYNVIDSLDNKNLYMVSTGECPEFSVCCTSVDDYDKLAVLDSPAFRYCLKQSDDLYYVRLYKRSRHAFFFRVHQLAKKQSMDSSFMKQFSSWFQQTLPSNKTVNR